MLAKRGAAVPRVSWTVLLHKCRRFWQFTCMADAALLWRDAAFLTNNN